MATITLQFLCLPYVHIDKHVDFLTIFNLSSNIPSGKLDPLICEPTATKIVIAAVGDSITRGPAEG